MGAIGSLSRERQREMSRTTFQVAGREGGREGLIAAGWQEASGGTRSGIVHPLRSGAQSGAPAFRMTAIHAGCGGGGGGEWHSLLIVSKKGSGVGLKARQSVGLCYAQSTRPVRFSTLSTDLYLLEAITVTFQKQKQYKHPDN